MKEDVEDDGSLDSMLDLEPEMKSYLERLEEQHASVGLRVVAAPLVRREGDEAWYEEPVP